MQLLTSLSSARRAIRPWALIAGLLASLLWIVHPVVHAGENLPSQHDHAHAHEHGQPTHQDTQCPLGAVRDVGATPQTQVVVPAAPLLISLGLNAAYSLILTSAPVDSAALPRPPPASCA